MCTVRIGGSAVVKAAVEQVVEQVGDIEWSTNSNFVDIKVRENTGGKVAEITGNQPGTARIKLSARGKKKGYKEGDDLERMVTAFDFTVTDDPHIAVTIGAITVPKTPPQPTPAPGPSGSKRVELG